VASSEDPPKFWNGQRSPIRFNAPRWSAAALLGGQIQKLSIASFFVKVTMRALTQEPPRNQVKYFLDMGFEVVAGTQFPVSGYGR